MEAAGCAGECRMSHTPGLSIKPAIALPKDPAACWVWLGTTNTDGVAQKTFGGESMPARRWVWRMLFGTIPHGFVISNICGNKACTNPHHLRCCTQAEANRAGPGTSLLPADVREIRAAKATRTHATAGVLASRFGVCESTIREIWRRKSWRTAPRVAREHNLSSTQGTNQ